jgi:TRAP-type C4-dicarboxylate transport system substrate-binding protein
MELNLLDKKCISDTNNFDYLFPHKLIESDDDLMERLPDVIKECYLKMMEEKEKEEEERKKEVDKENLKKSGFVRVQNDALDRKEAVRDRLRKKLISKYE